jgi:RNA recognition motif-containing protein
MLILCFCVLCFLNVLRIYPMSMSKIYVGNLPFKTTESDMKTLFEQFGEIQEIAMIKDRYSNEFKGFCFITFQSQESAQNALALDGKEFSGRPMKVNMARENERRSGGGGGAGGGRRFGGGAGGGRGGEGDRRSSGGGRRERW